MGESTYNHGEPEYRNLTFIFLRFCPLFVQKLRLIMKVVEKIGFTNRPMLLLGLLLMIFGIQIFSIGLVGELIIFSHSKEMIDCEGEEIIE